MAKPARALPAAWICNGMMLIVGENASAQAGAKHF
jgi:hypothetical protein